MKQIFITILFIILNLAAYTQTTKYVADKKESYIKYQMSHPLHDWEGISNVVNSVMIVNSQSNKIERAAVKVKVSSFDSHNANRDSHMLDVTEALKYPYVTFETTKITDNGNDMTVSGKLKFHGVTKNITITAKKNVLNSGEILITSDFDVKVTDFNIKLPRLFGMPIEDRISLFVNITYKKSN